MLLSEAYQFQTCLESGYQCDLKQAQAVAVPVLHLMRFRSPLSLISRYLKQTVWYAWQPL